MENCFSDGGIGSNINQEIVIKNEENENTTESLDSILETAFLQACKTSGKKIEFPVLSSNFYRSHILSSLPPGMSFDVKKTSFKKLSKFLEKMASEGLLTVNEPKKGVEMITKINYEHERFAQHRVIKYDHVEAVSSTKEEKVIKVGNYLV